MKYILTLLCTVALIAACKKDKSPSTPGTNTNPPNNPTQPTVGDSTLKIKGIDTLITMYNYDSISLPFTIFCDTGIAQNVTVSFSTSLPMRMKSAFTSTSGTTPFTTTLKLYTYFILPMSTPDTITISVQAGNGKTTTYSYPLILKSHECHETLYKLYLKDPKLNMYSTEYFEMPGIYVSNGAKLNYDGTTKRLFFTNLYLGQFNGKDYWTVDDMNDITNNMISHNTASNGRTFCASGIIDFQGATVRGYNGTDTATFTMFSNYLDAYRDDDNDDSTYRLSYSVKHADTGTRDKYFYVEGKFSF